MKPTVETVKRYNIDMQGRRAVEHEDGQWCPASETIALAAQVRELEYALECSKNFGAAVNARVTELEKAIATAREEIRNEFREALTAASRILAAFSRDKGKDGQGVKVSDMAHARQLLHKALYAEAGGGEHGR